MLRKLLDRARDLWLRALREHTTPRELALSVALGVFVGCTPFLGLHIWIALGMATLFRLNRLWAAIGSRASFFLIFPWIVLAEIQLAHRVRAGQWAPIFARDVMEHRKEYALDWSLGVVPVGLVLGLVIGSIAYVLAKRRALRPRTPSRSRPPSSESPP